MLVDSWRGYGLLYKKTAATMVSQTVAEIKKTILSQKKAVIPLYQQEFSSYPISMVFAVSDASFLICASTFRRNRARVSKPDLYADTYCKTSNSSVKSASVAMENRRS